MVYSGARGGRGANGAASSALEELRREVAAQEERVRLMEQRKQMRDELLVRLRATLVDTQPDGLRTISAEAEQLLSDIAAAAPSSAPGPSDTAAGEHEREDDDAVVGASVEDYFMDHSDRGRGEKEKKKRGRRRTKAQKRQAARQHADPHVSPDGFDASKARVINAKAAQEAAEHRERLCDLVDDFVATAGPLPPREAAGAPAWLEEGDGSGGQPGGSGSCRGPAPDAGPATDAADSKKQPPRLPRERRAELSMEVLKSVQEDEYSDDFEEEDP